MAEGEELCTNCGAPRVAGYASCKYCKTPFAHVGNTQTNAIPCPRCNTLNELGVQKCVQCQTWVVVQCVFCHALSPHNAPTCSKCGEAFAGAPQRFAERQQQERLQQGLQIAGQVGNVAASVLGAAAAVGVFGGHSHGHHHHHHGGDADPRYGGHDSSPGFFDSVFSGSSDGGGAGAGIEQQGASVGFFDSVFSGGSDDGDTGAGIEQSDGDSGGSFWDSSSSDDSSDDSSSSDDDSDGGFWDSDD